MSKNKFIDIQKIFTIDDWILDKFVYDLYDVKRRYQAHSKFLDRREQVYSARTYFYEGEEKCDENTEVFLKCIETTGATATNGFAAIKVTALGRPALLVCLPRYDFAHIFNVFTYFFRVLSFLAFFFTILRSICRLLQSGPIASFLRSNLDKLRFHVIRYF